jgi:hypothetical protein
MVKAPRFWNVSGASSKFRPAGCAIEQWTFQKHVCKKKNQTKCITDKHHSFPDLIYACNWFAHGSHVGMVDWICRDQNLRSLGEETV